VRENCHEKPSDADRRMTQCVPPRGESAILKTIGLEEVARFQLRVLDGGDAALAATCAALKWGLARLHLQDRICPEHTRGASFCRRGAPRTRIADQFTGT